MHILVATDGSAESGAVVRFSAVLAQRLAGTLTLLHVVLPSQERGEGEAVLRSAQASAAESSSGSAARSSPISRRRPPYSPTSLLRITSTLCSNSSRCRRTACGTRVP